MSNAAQTNDFDAPEVKEAAIEEGVFSAFLASPSDPEAGVKFDISMRDALFTGHDMCGLSEFLEREIDEALEGDDPRHSFQLLAEKFELLAWNLRYVIRESRKAKWSNLTSPEVMAQIEAALERRQGNV